MTLFNHSKEPNLFGTPLGADFPRALVDGLLGAYAGQPPEALARVHLVLNTRRMARRVKDLFDEGGARLLPRISLISEMSGFALTAGIPMPISRLERQIEVAPLIAKLLENNKEIAPRAAVFELAASLVELVAEMHEQGVTPESVAALDVTDQSQHWAHMLEFMQIAQSYLEAEPERIDAGAAQRLLAEVLTSSWQVKPPRYPLIVAGSTGSRGPTAMFIEAVARLPLGAVVLPGFDFDFAERSWSALPKGAMGEDHPQYRFEALLHALESRPSDVARWPEGNAPNAQRNRLLSLALRPAPVTDQWLKEAKEASLLLPKALEDVTLVEAPNQRIEALTIALRLRKAAEDGTRAALITPDGTLARQVTAALDRWGIIPDDSAGEPLHLSPVGRLLRLVINLIGEAERPRAETIIALLKHPLCAPSVLPRGPHLRLTRELVLYLRDKGAPHPTPETLAAWLEARKNEEAADWCAWLQSLFWGQTAPAPQLHAITHRMIAVAEELTTGREPIWTRDDGKEARRILDELKVCEDVMLTVPDFSRLIDSAFTRTEMRRDTTRAHPDIFIWGTLEARVQGMDLLILAGLNEGTWPETPAPDPWLNRAMRLRLGMLLPERRIGLSAHDFQQAVAAKEVWLTRAVRSDEAETVGSRWLIRLTNLLEGLPKLPSEDKPRGEKALLSMRRRGTSWVRLAEGIDAPQGKPQPAARPAPCPPVAQRPRRLSITEIQKLIRDPYAIYARHVLKLRPLNPLQREPDHLERGNALHKVMEEFVKEAQENPELLTRDQLVAKAEAVLDRDVPYPATKLMWLARFEKIVDILVKDERARLSNVAQVMTETKGALDLKDVGFTLSGKADRFDTLEDGTLAIYDYKSGKISNSKVRNHFDKQLQLTAAMAEEGAFNGLPARTVSHLAFIGLGSKAEVSVLKEEEFGTAQTLEELRKLIAAFLVLDKGYPSRRAVQEERFDGDYDHLARYGEWSTDTPAKKEHLT